MASAQWGRVACILAAASLAGCSLETGGTGSSARHGLHVDDPGPVSSDAGGDRPDDPQLPRQVQTDGGPVTADASPGADGDAAAGPSGQCVYQLEDALGNRLCEGTHETLPCPDLRDGSGNGLDLGDDGAELEYERAFLFPFYDNRSSLFVIDANGFIALDGSAESRPDNTDLSLYDGAEPILAPFWDDLVGEAGEVLWRRDGSYPDSALAVQWAGSRKAAGDIDVRVVLHQADGRIELCYVDTDTGDARYDSGASASVGTAAAGGAATLAYGFDSPVVPSGTYLRIERTLQDRETFEGCNVGAPLQSQEPWNRPKDANNLRCTDSNAHAGERAVLHLGASGEGAAERAVGPHEDGVLSLRAMVHVSGNTAPVRLTLGQNQHHGGDPDEATVSLTPSVLQLTADASADVREASEVVQHDGWHQLRLDLDFGRGEAIAYYDGVEMVRAATEITSVDSVRLGIGAASVSGAYSYADDIAVTHRQ